MPNRNPRKSPSTQLATYRKKRNFSITSEPAGAREKPNTSERLKFVIQKHDASHLHYDFRLELDGVLKSWAVPKGPSLDPAKKSLVIEVEDHPLEYGSFEGIIPAGQYGGGTVLLWDQGTWELTDDPANSYERGKLHFVLHGKKLRGEWALVRMHPRPGQTKNQWLLMKIKDQYASTTLDITSDETSVKSGRTLAKIAADRDDVWNSNREGKKSPSATRKLAKPVSAKRVDDTAPNIKLTHPDKVLYPDRKITKQDLVAYYRLVAAFILPHIVNRPLTLFRCPNGTATTGKGPKCFYQRNWTDTLPPDVAKVDDKSEQHIAIRNLAGLLSLVQISVLEVHTWNCKMDDLEEPDQLIFDLDPAPDLPWKRVVAGARMLNKTLEELRLPTFLKTSGGKGLHITIPIEPNINWKAAKSFCQHVAESLVNDSDLFVANMRKDLRHGKIFIDYHRNDRTATAVAPYSTRARPGAAVSMPIAWSELGRLKSADYFTVDTAEKYLSKRKVDPWAGFDRARVDLRKIAGR